MSLVILAMVLGPALVGVSGAITLNGDWRTANRDSAGLAPDPATTPEAVIQVYAARAFNWRGLFAVHTWIATKARDADSFTVYQVVGWNLRHRGTVVEVASDVPDRRWYDAEPRVIADLRGATAEPLLPKIAAAAARYPHADEYRVWPGPNSNTFVAYIAREVPELNLALPATAIGKDYLANADLFGRAPSGTGVQVSLAGTLGLLAARTEGLEVNLFGLVFGIDPVPPAISLPGIGRIGFGR